jgi:hypothetical protein
MSKFLNLTPLVIKGKGGELVHSPCALFKSTFLQKSVKSTFLQKSDCDYWDIEGSNYDIERAFEKLRIHYSSVIMEPEVATSNPRWKAEWIRANMNELGVFNRSYGEDFEIVDGWGGGYDFTHLDLYHMFDCGHRKIFRCTPAGGEIPEGLFSDQELNFPNMHAKAVPFTEEEIPASFKESYYQGWSVDENWVIDEENEENEEIEILKEQIIQLQKSNDEMRKILNLLLKSSDTHNITYNIHDSAISGDFNIDDNSD